LKPTTKVFDQRERREDILRGKEKLELEIVHLANKGYVVNFFILLC